MNTLKNTVWNKRLPSFIGVLFLTLSIGTIGWLSSNAVLFGTKAAVDNTPKNVKITNISDSSFTVSYLTDDKVTGSVNYGKTQALSQVAFDDRDQQATQHFAHHITIKNLEASTKYFFTITSGDANFLNNNLPYETTTLNTANPLSDKFILNGKIALDDGKIPEETIVYILSENKTILSALTNNGNYQINLSAITNLNDNNVLNLQAFDRQKQSNVSLLASQINPVPLIILSKDYDFSLGNEPLTPSPTASAAGTITPVAFPISEDNQTETKPQIINPEKDQEFKDQQPLFTGKAIPNAEVEITIESEEPIKTTIKANANGNWQYRPEVKLLPGNHTITIKTTDESGIIRTITQSFVVFAEGSEFVEPSVSPTPIKSGPTAKPTITPTTQPTQTPTPSPTTAPTATPTTIPTSSKTPSPTSQQAAIPVTGNTSLVITIIGIISAVSIGALLFFLTAV